MRLRSISTIARDEPNRSTLPERPQVRSRPLAKRRRQYRPAMTDSLAIALAQLDLTVGDLQGNEASILRARAAVFAVAGA